MIESEDEIGFCEQGPHKSTWTRNQDPCFNGLCYMRNLYVGTKSVAVAISKVLLLGPSSLELQVPALRD